MWLILKADLPVISFPFQKLYEIITFMITEMSCPFRDCAFYSCCYIVSQPKVEQIPIYENSLFYQRAVARHERPSPQNERAASLRMVLVIRQTASPQLVSKHLTRPNEIIISYLAGSLIITVYLLNNTVFYARFASGCCIKLTSPIQHSEYNILKQFMHYTACTVSHHD